MMDMQQSYIDDLARAVRQDSAKEVVRRLRRRVLYQEGPPLRPDESGASVILFELLDVLGEKGDAVALGKLRESVDMMVVESVRAAVYTSGDGEAERFFVATRAVSLAGAMVWPGPKPADAVLFLLESDRSPPHVEQRTAPGLREYAAPRLCALEVLIAIAPEFRSAIKRNAERLWTHLDPLRESGSSPMRDIRILQRVRLHRAMTAYDPGFCATRHFELHRNLAQAGGGLGNIAGLTLPLEYAHGRAAVERMLLAATNDDDLNKRLAGSRKEHEKAYHEQLMSLDSRYPKVAKAAWRTQRAGGYPIRRVS